MRRAGSLVLALVLALGAAFAGGCSGDSEAADVVYRQRDDDRVASLFGPCTKSDHYDRPIADMIPILVEKLERGARDPMVRAKEELSAAGEAAIPELRRLVQRHFTETHGAAYLTNALDVLKLSKAEGAHEILRQCLEHPGDSVRLAAIQALQLTHARPEDFDVLAAHLDVEVLEQRHQVAIAMHSADPVRAEAIYLDWIENGQRTGLHPFIAPFLARSVTPETVARCAELFSRVELRVAAYLAAPAARAGDEAAMAYLREELARTSEPIDVQRRTTALGAAIEAGLEELMRVVLSADPDGNLRAIAADGLATADTVSEESRAVLAFGLDDHKPAVRAACLNALVERGDAEAIDRALALLEGTTLSLQEGMTALVRRMATDPDVAARAYARLADRNALEDFLPLSERTATLKSLGQIPSAEAARLLRELGVKHAGEVIERLDAHRWLMIHAANTGPEGRAYLRAEFAEERDPARRLDLLWAGTAARTDAVRAALHGLVEDEGLTVEERLVACDRLLSLGPASAVAPALKRLAPRIDDAEARITLQCWLWEWY